MTVIEGTTLAQALIEIDGSPDAAVLLTVGIPDCDSCKALHNDIDLIMARIGPARHVRAILDIGSDSELPSMNRLRLTDVPATYLFEYGQVKGGWFGYDFDVPQSHRVANLAQKILARRSV